MSEFEKYLRENKDEFDREEPIEGHAERFLKKLEKQDLEENKSRITFWRVAAAVIVLVAVSISVLVPKFNHVEDAQYASLSLGDVSAELADVEFYYQSKLEVESNKLAVLAETDSTVKSYFEEIEKLKSEYQGLQNALYTSGAHDRVIQAMIENFRLRLEILESLEEKKNYLDNEDDQLSYHSPGNKERRKAFKKAAKTRRAALKTRNKAIRTSNKQLRQTKHIQLNTLKS